MARFEAQWQSPGLAAGEIRDLVSHLAQELPSTATWLDANNVSLPLILQPSGLTVQVLLEFQPRGPLTILVNSREGMGYGAPQSRQVLEQLLAVMTRLLPQAQLLYRSDRDGPIRQQALA